MNRTPLVIYHAKCYDGFTAAWIARTALGPETECYPGVYGELPPYELAKYREVYVIDFSYPREQMLVLNDFAGSLLVLDHHATAKYNCEGLPFCEFDMDRSGAGMAWDHFNPKYRRPEWIDCVEDRDLWRFKCGGTKECHAFLTSMEMTFELWDIVDGTPFDEIIQGGQVIARSISNYCRTAAQEARLVSLDGCRAIVVNATYQNSSELMHLMLEQHSEADFAVCYFQRADGAWQYGLRSREGFDVSQIAKRYGGGGHKQSSGFETNYLLAEILYTGLPLDIPNPCQEVDIPAR